MPTSKAPKDPQEDREPQRRQDGSGEEVDLDEADVETESHAEEQELADADLEELSADDLKDMEGPDA